MSDQPIEVTLTRRDGFRFEVDFGSDLPGLVMDEPAPLGEDQGPNATRVLAAAVANCLSASLLFCLQKRRVDVDAVTARIRYQPERNPDGRVRIDRMDVEISLDLGGEDDNRADRCLELFEDFCVVTQSVRQGIDVNVTVVDGQGRSLAAG